MDDLVLYNLIYFLIAFFLVYPPQEVQSVGLTLPNLFHSLLGSEELCFVHYHLIRISLSVVVHSLLPLGYYLFIGVNVPNFNLFSFSETSQWWKIYLIISVLLAIGLITLVYYWFAQFFCISE